MQKEAIAGLLAKAIPFAKNFLPAIGKGLKSMFANDTIKNIALWVGIGQAADLALSPLRTKMQKKQMEELARWQAYLNQKYGLTPQQQMKTASLASALGSILRGVASAGAMYEVISDVTKRLKATPLYGRAVNLAALVDALLRKHKDWDRQKVMKYLGTIKRYAPLVLTDPALVEEVMIRIMNYGGLDPAFLSELVELQRTLEGGKK